MRKILENNNALKLISFFISFSLWIYVAVVVNPEREVTLRGVPISYSGHQSLLEQNYMISLQSDENITLKLKGPINLISQVSKENVSAYIDLSGYTSEGTYLLPVKVRLPFEQISVSDKTVYNASVVISRVYSHKFDVQIKYTGKLKDEFVLENSNTSTGIKVDVSGPADIVKSIDMAAVTADLNGVKSDFNIKGEIKLFKSNGDIIDKHNLSVSPNEAEVSVKLLKKKTVPVTVDFDEEGYTAEITSDNNITILGKPSDIDGITSVMTEKITVTEPENEETKEVSAVLPSGIKAEKNKLKFTVKITKDETSN